MAAKPKIVENSNKLKDSAVRIKDSAAHMSAVLRVSRTAPTDGLNWPPTGLYSLLNERMQRGCARVLLRWRVVSARKHS
jgi:hypothetical protein